MGDTEDDLNQPHGYEEDAWETQYGPTRRDARHRLAITGIYDLPLGFQLSALFYYRSSLPWNAVYAGDVNKDGLSGDYVDEHRNSRRGFDSYYLNARISKYIQISRIRLQFFGEVYNLTNKTSFTNIANVYDTPNFGKPIQADNQRLIQIGIRLDF